MNDSLREYCLRTHPDAVLNEWCAEKNAPLSPDTIGYASHRKVWWRCKNGHEWLASPDGRKNGAACPYCAGMKPIQGETDLASVSPDLAAEWHPTKNGALTPADVLPGSKRTVWWRCKNGHEWAASPNSRKGGAGCPICNPAVSLADRFPDLAAEWDTERNASAPDRVSPNSAASVWWKCAQGHAWRERVSARTQGDSPCPVCANTRLVPGVNDLETLFPDLAAAWASENAGLSPRDVLPKSSKRVLWNCPNGHVYRASVADRTAQKGDCPYCAGRLHPQGRADLETLFPDLAAEWHPVRNGQLRPGEITPASPKRIWWRCKNGHAFSATVQSRLANGLSCPVCAASDARVGVG